MSKDSGQRLDKYVSRLLPLAPKAFLYKAFRNKDIRLNNQKASGSELLNEGDLIQVRFPQLQYESLGGTELAPLTDSHASGPADPSVNPFPASYGKIVFEDEDLILADKKSGVLSQKAKPEDKSINEALLNYCGGRTATFTPSICNRLDRNTSGLIVFAKTYRGAAKMAKLFKERKLRKFYLAAVWGKITENGHCKARLLKDRENNIVRIVQEDIDGGADSKTDHVGPGQAAETETVRVGPEQAAEIETVRVDPEQAAEIETAWVPLTHASIEGRDVTLLKVELLTGKTHQIRAHLSSIGHPVLGDPKYGSGKCKEAPRLMLHSYQMEIPGRGSFFAKAPECFLKLFPMLSENG